MKDLNGTRLLKCPSVVGAGFKPLSPDREPDPIEEQSLKITDIRVKLHFPSDALHKSFSVLSFS